MHQRRRFVSRVRRSLLTLSLPAAMLVAADAVADGVTPIEITMLGPGAARIRVASGTTFPCDSSDNRRLIEGKYEPGRVVRSSTPAHCVCFQQTYQPFSESDWGASSMVCRPQICTNIGRKKCVPALDPTIRLQVRSQRPR
jgi:hypothetical protein